MSDPEATGQPQNQDPAPDPKPDPQVQDPKKSPPSISSFSFSIWPPSQKTRDAVASRLIETLSTESVLSKRYGTIPPDEASDAAHRIEEEAFGVASVAASGADSVNTDDGIEILQMYSKEISKRMLEIVKSRAQSESTKEENDASSEVADAEAVAASEEVASPAEAEA